MRLTVIACLVLASCASPKTKRDAAGVVTVKSGNVVRTTVTIFPDGKVVTTTEPVNWIEAAIGGVTKGALGFLNTSRHDAPR